MAQFKIFGRLDYLREAHQAIGDGIQRAAVRTLRLPEDKRFQRFIGLESWQLVAPQDRSERYLIIEVLMFTGRTLETRKALVRALLDELTATLQLHVNDVEVTIVESPRENWGIRGQHGDELALNYKVEL